MLSIDKGPLSALKASSTGSHGWSARHPSRPINALIAKGCTGSPAATRSRRATSASHSLRLSVSERTRKLRSGFGSVRSSIHVGLQGRIDEAIHRRRDAVPASEFDHFAGEPAQLEPVAAEQVVPHRGGVVRRHGAHHRERLLDAVRRQPDPLGEADGDGFAQGRFIEGAKRSGSSRHFPSGNRVSALSPLSGTNKMNFSQTGIMMSRLSTPSNPAASQRSRRRWPRSLIQPSSSPKVIRYRCRSGGSLRATIMPVTNAMPPITASSPRTRISRSGGFDTDLGLPQFCDPTIGADLLGDIFDVPQFDARQNDIDGAWRCHQSPEPAGYGSRRGHPRYAARSHGSPRDALCTRRRSRPPRPWRARRHRARRYHPCRLRRCTSS
jgi:hypothetical protein